ncbi:hypothetical protein C9374_009736 [Naegleria lovaniensis]|uniref:Uncharacterized protein n=1 Tax=Naegleria lovaniensis TaxID=51637 RepID=A0AA88KS02_NAELO|nr:uncharacterized protein C9374_009736 [Naegleria lovaniensis]KAG2393159.1 hypothetical protein C9374_009736 [Naegleria lovaniensis]
MPKNQNTLLDFDDDDMLTPNVAPSQSNVFPPPFPSSNNNSMRSMNSTDEFNQHSSGVNTQQHLMATKNDVFTPTTPTTIPENTSFIQLKKFVELTSGSQQHLLDNDNAKVISPMIQTKLAQRKVLEIIKELDGYMAESQDPKKMNGSKISKVLDELTLYFATENMVDEKLPYHVSVSLAIDVDRISSTMTTLVNRLLTLLGVDDRRVVALVHYMLSEINLPRDLREKTLSALKSEFTKSAENNCVRGYCLRTIDRICRSSFPSRKDAAGHLKDLYEMIQMVVKDLGKENSFSTKKGLISKLFKDTDKEEKLFLLRTALQIVKNSISDPVLTKGILENVIVCVKNKSPHCSRDASTVIAGLVTISPGPTLFAFSSSIPQFEVNTDKKKPTKAITHSKLKELKDDKKVELFPTMNAQDVFSRFYLARICSSIIKPMVFSSEEAEESEDAPYEQKYIDTLKHLLHDEDLTIFFETVKQVSLRNFKFFLEKDIHQEKSLTLEFVVTRICNSLNKSKPQIQIHAACRATYYLMRCYERFRAILDADPYSSLSQNTPEMKQANAIFQKLYKKIDSVLIHDCSFVKFQAFKACIWRLDKVSQVVRRLKMEIKSNVNWMPFHIHELLMTLLEFSKNRPSVFDEFANLCSYICIDLSERVDVDLLIALFKQLIPTKQKDQRQIELTTRFLSMVFTILDECLTGSKESSELAFSILTFLGEYANKICDEPSVHEKESTEDSGTVNITDPKIIYEQPDTFDIHNAAMKSIILKLIQNTMYNTPQIRTCCLEGLAKIAFRSLDPIRLFVYEFLSYMSQHEYFGVSAKCKSITNVLDEVYLLQQHFVKLTSSKDVTDEAIVAFFDDHERVKEKINFFARSNPAFLPLGNDSRQFLKRAFDVKHQQGFLRQ